MVKDRPTKLKDLSSRKKLKCFYFSAKNNLYPHMLQMDERDDTCKLVVMNKRNKKWSEKFMDLFIALDNINPKKAAEDRKRKRYYSESKHRCLRNINKMCNEKPPLLKLIKVIPVEESIKILHIKFLCIPESWRHIKEPCKMFLSEGEQGMEMSYLNSPSESTAVVPILPVHFPMSHDGSSKDYENKESRSPEDDAVMVEEIGVFETSEASTAIKKKMFLSEGEQGMEMSYLNSPSESTAVVPISPVHFPMSHEGSSKDYENEESRSPEDDAVMVEEIGVFETSEASAAIKKKGDTFPNRETDSSLLLISKEDLEKNISPSSEIQNTRMEMSYLNNLFPYEDSMDDSASTSESIYFQSSMNPNIKLEENVYLISTTENAPAQTFIILNENPEKNISPISEARNTWMVMYNVLQIPFINSMVDSNSTTANVSMQPFDSLSNMENNETYSAQLLENNSDVHSLNGTTNAYLDPKEARRVLKDGDQRLSKLGNLHLEDWINDVNEQ